MKWLINNNKSSVKGYRPRELYAWIAYVKRRRSKCEKNTIDHVT